MLVYCHSLFAHEYDNIKLYQMIQVVENLLFKNFCRRDVLLACGMEGVLLQKRAREI